MLGDMMEPNRYDIDDVTEAPRGTGKYMLRTAWASVRPEGPAPVVYGDKVFAWRAFHILYDFGEQDNIVLRSPRHGSQLKAAPAEHLAICGVAELHMAPQFDCQCGWYCYATLRDFMRLSRTYGVPRNGLSMTWGLGMDGRLHNNRPSWLAIALVSVSGRAILHSHGMRVQRIHLEKLFSTCPGHVRSEIRRKYGVKVLPLEMLGRMPLPNKGGTISLSNQVLRPTQVLQDEVDKWTNPMGR